MGTSDIFVRQVEREWSATVDGVSHPDIPGDISYELVARQAADSGNIHIVGFGSLDMLDGVEIAGVMDEAPEGFGDPATGDFSGLYHIWNGGNGGRGRGRLLHVQATAP